MKKLFTQLFILALCTLSTQLFANTVIVKGYIQYSNGTAAANRTVKISVDSAACTVQHTKTTNANGYYIDTLTCNGDIRVVRISTEDCNGNVLINTPHVASGTNTVENNFSLSCVPTVAPVCSAGFRDSVSGTTIKFYSNASTSSNDTIINRTWYFGDSSVITGNLENLTYQFPKPGTYNVCLAIQTSKGCTNKACYTITIPAPAPPVCATNFRDSIKGNTVNFYGLSSVASGDSVISRNWYFGDSSTSNAGSTATNPTHQFAKAGTYTVCLYTKNASGCESHFCNTIVIAPPPPVICATYFKDSVSGNTVKFYGTVSSNDSVISRNWYFGDSSNTSTAGSSDVNPTHQFAKAGTYNVCLYTKTAKGCESHICNTVTIVAPPPPVCYTTFRDTVKGNTVNFYAVNGVSTGDSVISRTWFFGDSTTANAGSTQTNPVHQYAKAGTYTVCLYSKTAKGCESKMCNTVTIVAPPPPVCYTNFRDTVKGNTVNFYAVNSVSTGDSVISRTWFFGDSTTANAGSTETNPVHQYAKAGTYTVCLYSKTAKGCESKMCNTVTIAPPPPPVCATTFRDTIKGSTVNFYGLNSVSSGDSVVSRTWIFGDNGSATGSSDINPTHQYAKAGTYNVCLYTKTVKGCESHICTNVTIAPPPPLVCATSFRDSVKGATVSFYGLNSVAAGDSVVSRTWIFGDSSTPNTVGSTAINPIHQYAKGGTYNVCLYTKTAKGCESKMCNTVTVVIAPPPPVICSATYRDSVQGNTVKFIGTATANDSIISRYWIFGDTSSTVIGSTTNDPAHQYAKAGAYNVCFYIKTAKGCESHICSNVYVAPPPAMVCNTSFRDSVFGNSIVVASTGTAPTNDSIISRTWIFGDTSTLTDNSIYATHQYAKPGTYTVCLYTKTAKGCESKMCNTVTIAPPPPNTNCKPQFTSEKIAERSIRFNSSSTWIPDGDSIIERRWSYGDGSSIDGNTASPVKQYGFPGIFTVCMKIKTAKGCENEYCATIIVTDSIPVPNNGSDYVNILSINPNPVSTQMTTVIWSKNNNVDAELAIYDIFGVKKWSVKKTLLQGNNTSTIATGFLSNGLYFLRVTSSYGVQSRLFYKF